MPPHADLESLTTFSAHNNGDPSPAAEDPGLPPDSYTIQIGDEMDIGWMEINPVYDRDVSTKGSTNPKSQLQAAANQKAATSTSQRWSGPLAPKAPIIGLPNKLQHSGFLDGHSTRRPPNARILPKGRKPQPPSDPGSPKVSCCGNLLLDPDRDRGPRRIRRSDSEGRGSGCWARLAAILCCGGGEAAERADLSVSPPAQMRRADVSASTSAAPGLGGMKRFASARRAESWGGDVDAGGEVGGRVSWSGPLDREERWARR